MAFVARTALRRGYATAAESVKVGFAGQHVDLRRLGREKGSDVGGRNMGGWRVLGGLGWREPRSPLGQAEFGGMSDADCKGGMCRWRTGSGDGMTARLTMRINLQQAPIQLNSLTGTYATSTYLAALKKGPKDLDALAKDVATFDKRIKEDDKIRQFIQNPTLSANERSKALSTILPSSSSPILLNLLTVLSENGRLASAEKVFADFNSLIAAYRGELEVIVTSAEPLDSKSLSRIEKALKGTQAAEGKTLRVTNRVNEGVIGGLLVDFGDKTIDLSASSKVNRFNAALSQGV